MPTVSETPVKPFTKPEFNTPVDLLEKAAELKGIKLPQPLPRLNLSPLVGTWSNADHATRDLVRLIISASGPIVCLNAFGACTPTPCDWGLVPANVFADSVLSGPTVAFTGQYKFSFKETLIVGRIEFGALFVETFNHFTDGSGRADYNTVSVFSK